MRIQKEQLLAKSLQNGDKSAYEQLYRNLFDGAVVYLSSTFDLSKNDAYDIISAVFARLPDIIDKYDSAQDFVKWFHTVVNNSARDYIKKELRSVPVESETLMQYAESTEINSEKSFEQIDRATRLHQIIAELSDKQNIAVTLHYLQGFTVDETAKRMKLKPSTVKEHLARAKKAIAEKVKLEGDRTHWLGGLIPKISAEITSKLEYLTNAGIEAKSVAVTIAAVAVAGGTAVPVHMNYPVQYAVPQESQAETAATIPVPQQIYTEPAKQGHIKIRKAPIGDIQAEVREEAEMSIREVNIVSVTDADKDRSRTQARDIKADFESGENQSEPQSEQAVPEVIPEVAASDETESRASEKAKPETFHLIDKNGNVVIMERVYDENGEPTPFAVSVGLIRISDAYDDEQTAELDAADGVYDILNEQLKNKLHGNSENSRPVIYDKNGNPSISAKNMTKGIPNNIESSNSLEENEPVVPISQDEAYEESESYTLDWTYDDLIYSDSESEENAAEGEEPEEADKLLQDAEAPSQSEEASDESDESEPITEDYDSAADISTVDTP